MVGPVDFGSSAVQKSVVNPFQQDRDNKTQVQQDRQPQQNRPQPAGTAAAGSQNIRQSQSATQNTGAEKTNPPLQSATNRGDDTEGASQRRGSLVDLSV